MVLYLPARDYLWGPRRIFHTGSSSRLDGDDSNRPVGSARADD